MLLAHKVELRPTAE